MRIPSDAVLIEEDAGAQTAPGGYRDRRRSDSLRTELAVYTTDPHFDLFPDLKRYHP